MSTDAERGFLTDACRKLEADRDRLAAEAAEYKSHYEEMCRENTALKARLEEAERIGLAMTHGWADREQGVALEACPHAMTDAEKQNWEKGWQWRDDQLRLALAEAAGMKMREALEHAKKVAWEGPAHREEWEDHSQRLFDAALASDLGRAALAERERLRAACQAALSEMQSPGRMTTAELIAQLRAALEEAKPCP